MNLNNVLVEELNYTTFLSFKPLIHSAPSFSLTYFVNHLNPQNLKISLNSKISAKSECFISEMDESSVFYASLQITVHSIFRESTFVTVACRLQPYSIKRLTNTPVYDFAHTPFEQHHGYCTVGLI